MLLSLSAVSVVCVKLDGKREGTARERKKKEQGGGPLCVFANCKYRHIAAVVIK